MGGRAADKGAIPRLNGTADGGWLTGGAAPTPTPRIDPLPWAAGMGTGMAPSAQQGEGPLLLEEHGEGGYQVERL